MNIFRKLVVDYKWEISADEKKLEKFFEDNRKIFEFNGGDLDTLIQCSKISHSRRVFTLEKDDKKKLVLEDLEGGLKAMMENEEVAKRKTSSNFDIIGHMYC
jgi:hypothetical protein